MKIWRTLLLAILFAGTAWLYPKLPEKIPMHWNIRGEIDSYQNKNPAAFFIPVLVIFMMILFESLPKIDPKYAKYQLFSREWEIIKTGFIIFFAWLQIIVIGVSIWPELEMMPFMFVGLGALFILIGNYLSKIRQNYFLGIKVPWTLSSEDNWNKTHRYAGWAFVLAGIVTVVGGYLLPQASVFIFGSIITASFLPIIYSYLLYKKQPQNMKYVYLVLILITVFIAGLRLFSPEDTWICESGSWVRHGNPRSPVPDTPCR